MSDPRLPTSGVIHERLERDEDPPPASPRSFAFVCAGAFAVYGVLPLWSGNAIRLWALALSLTILVVGLVTPAVLVPASQAWQKLGLALHHVVSPIVLRILFYGIVTPFGLVTRLTSKSLAARLRRDSSAATYWISRERVPTSPMTNQF